MADIWVCSFLTGALKSFCSFRGQNVDTEVEPQSQKASRGKH